MSQQTTAREYSREIIAHAEEHHQRTGQYLFNSFPREVGDVIAGQLFDPFHRDLSQFQIEEWILAHLVFNDNERIVAVFDGNTILWEG